MNYVLHHNIVIRPFDFSVMLELSKVHNQELQSLDKTLKDAEATLSVSLFLFFSLYHRNSHIKTCHDTIYLCLEPVNKNFIQ